MSRKIKTIITERYQERPEVTLEGWLLELQDRPEIVAVRVFKRRGADWKALPRDTDILPPFDVDPHCIFRKWGDGEYRFVGVRRDGKLAGSRIESVIGYQDGELGGRDKSSIGHRSSRDFLEQMREVIEWERLMLELDRLNRSRSSR